MTYLQFAIERNLMHDTPDECRFSLAILTNKCHLLASFYNKVNAREDCMIAICLANLVTDNGIVATP